MSLCYKCTNSLEQLSYLTNLALILLTLPSSYWPCPHLIDIALVLLTFPSSYWPCMLLSYWPCPHLTDLAFVFTDLASLKHVARLQWLEQTPDSRITPLSKDADVNLGVRARVRLVCCEHLHLVLMHCGIAITPLIWTDIQMSLNREDIWISSTYATYTKMLSIV